MQTRTIAILIVGAVAIGSCGARGERTLATGALGAATGAIIGAIGGNTALGAITGGIVGSAAGYLTCRRTYYGRCR